MLTHGANANACDKWNYTPLHEAAAKGKLDVCVVLLQHGADIHIRNDDNKTAVDLADASAKVCCKVIMLTVDVTFGCVSN